MILKHFETTNYYISFITIVNIAAIIIRAFFFSHIFYIEESATYLVQNSLRGSKWRVVRSVRGMLQEEGMNSFQHLR